MNVIFPKPPVGQTYLQQLVTLFERIFPSIISQDQAMHRLMLQSPDGTVYSVTMNNGGTLHIAQADKTAP